MASLLKRCGMLRVKSFLVALICLYPLGAGATTLYPEPIVVSLEKNAGWSKFRFDINDRDGIWLDANAPPEQSPMAAVSFHVLLEEKATLQVTDAYRWGDVFKVFANEELLGFTGDPEIEIYSGDDHFSDFEIAHGDPSWSSGEWHLSAGEYIITGQVVRMPELRGSGALRLIDFNGSGPDDPYDEDDFSDVTTMPLPGSFSLLLAGAAACAVVSRRRKSKEERA